MAVGSTRSTEKSLERKRTYSSPDRDRGWEDSTAIATTRSRPVLIILHNHLGDEHKPDARNQPDNTRIPPFIGKTNKTSNPGFCDLFMPCRAHLLRRGVSVADGSNGNLHLRVRTFSIHPRSGFSGRGWKGAKADVVNTIPGMELCWPSLSWEPRGPHCMCVIYSPTVHS